MELVKAGRSRQVTIPKQIFDSLGLKEGDYVQVEVEGGRIVLTPVAVINKEKAKSEFFQLVQKVRTNAQAFTEEEIEEEIRTALEESRREKWPKNWKSRTRHQCSDICNHIQQEFSCKNPWSLERGCFWACFLWRNSTRADRCPVATETVTHHRDQ